LKIPENYPALADTNLFSKIIINKDPEFINDLKNPVDLQLDTLSPAKDAADPEIIVAWPSLQYDIKGNLRTSDTGPDIGAFERIE